MVPTVENRSRVWCSPVSEPEPGPSAGWSTFTVKIERTAELPDSTHLMAESAGQKYTAIVPPTFLDELSSLQVWVVDVEVIGPNRIAVRDMAADA